MSSDFLQTLLSTSARTIKTSEIREILELTRGGDIISFAGGLPHPDVFPVADIADCAATVLRQRGQLALQYGPSRGDKELLDEIWELSEAELANGPAAHLFSQENLLVTSGSQQGLDLLAKLLLDPNDVVLVGLPSYIGALQAFESLRAKFVGVKLDEDGMCPDSLQQRLSELHSQGMRPKMVYTVPDFQNPTGVCLSIERRRRIVELVSQYETLLIEDCPYRQLRFEGESLPTMISQDLSQRTVALNTFSKVLVPGVRLGWILAHADIIEKLVLLKQATDLCSPSFNQAVVAEYCSRGLLSSHLRQVIDVYRVKRDMMLEQLDAHMPKAEGLRWTRPHGGLFLWVTLPEAIDAAQLLHQAIAAGVAYVIGQAFHCDGSGANTLRLNFSYASPEEIRSGIQRLAKIIGAALA